MSSAFRALAKRLHERDVLPFLRGLPFKITIFFGMMISSIFCDNLTLFPIYTMIIKSAG